MEIAKLAKIDAPKYFKSMIEGINHTELFESFEITKNETIQLFSSIPDNRESFTYAPGKWNVKQLAQHLVDCERILCYRALSMARKERKQLLGFDEDSYVENDFTDTRNLQEIVRDFELCRDSTISLFKSFHTDSIDFKGNANGIEMTPRLIGWFITAHNSHHLKVLKERYLDKWN